MLDSAAYRPQDPPSGLYRLLAVPGFGTGFARLIGPNLRRGRFAKVSSRSSPAIRRRRTLSKRGPSIWNQPKVTTTVAHEALHATAEMAAMSPAYKEIACPTFIAVPGRQFLPPRNVRTAPAGNSRLRIAAAQRHGPLRSRREGQRSHRVDSQGGRPGQEPSGGRPPAELAVRAGQ